MGKMEVKGEHKQIGKQARKGEQEIKLDINMVEHEEFDFSAGSQGKL